MKIEASRSPYNPLFISLFDSLLEEAERHAHDPSRTTIWLETIPQELFPVLGLQLVASFRRLVPLLLEWCTSIQKKVRLGSLRAVHAVICATWPRMPAHAAVIWDVVEAAYQDESALSAHPSQEILSASVKVGEALWRNGGKAFQERIKEYNFRNRSGGLHESGRGLPSLLDRVLSAEEVLKGGVSVEKIQQKHKAIIEEL